MRYQALRIVYITMAMLAIVGCGKSSSHNRRTNSASIAIQPDLVTNEPTLVTTSNENPMVGTAVTQISTPTRSMTYEGPSRDQTTPTMSATESDTDIVATTATTTQATIIIPTRTYNETPTLPVLSTSTASITICNNPDNCVPSLHQFGTVVETGYFFTVEYTNKLQLFAVGQYPNGTKAAITDPGLVWSSSAADVTIDAMGLVTGVKPDGLARITLSYKGESAMATIFVGPPTLKGMSLKTPCDAQNIKVGDVCKFNAIGNFSDGSERDVSTVQPLMYNIGGKNTTIDPKIYWSVDLSSAATVTDNGTVTFNSPSNVNLNAFVGYHPDGGYYTVGSGILLIVKP